MSPGRNVIEGFYRAIQEHDPKALLGALHPGFVVHVAPGLPFSTGGTHEGPETALGKLWGVVFQHYEIAPYAETWEETTMGTFVVTGHYRGTARATGRTVEAEFVHLWRLTDGQISWLHQCTDTARWHEALNPV